MRFPQRPLTILVFVIGVFASGFALSQDPPSVSTATEHSRSIDLQPILLLTVGMVAVLGMIIGLKLNAFLALIFSALLVSLLIGFTADQSASSRMDAVTTAFGGSAKSIGIVIAMATIIGKCMLDSGAADRIVRFSVRLTGEKKATFGLLGSSFVLAVPVFYDTVFYLLVPLARSLYRRTNKHYLRYLMAIATGAAVTHTLVPPTPGPLLVSAILGVDIGMMMLAGALVAIPSATVGILFSYWVDHRSPVGMRALVTTENEHKPLAEDQLPSLGVSLLPVLLPVLLIGLGTLTTTIADREDRALLSPSDIRDYETFARQLSTAQPGTPGGQILGSKTLSETQRLELVRPAETAAQKMKLVGMLNQVLLDKDFYDEKAFLGVPLSDVVKDKLAANQLRMKPVDRRRMNRALVEASFPDLVEKHTWNSPARQLADRLSLWSNPDFALMLSAICAMWTLKRIRGLSWRDLSKDVEASLMSAGVIILITAAGGAFGAMLTQTEISGVIQDAFENKSGSGIMLIVLAWTISSVLRLAQGSSTVAMIIAAGMMSAIIGDQKLNYNMAFIATAVGSGSLFGSWMNDSGFWIFTKMGGLTENESLRSWTPLLTILSISGLIATLVLSQLMPL